MTDCSALSAALPVAPLQSLVTPETERAEVKLSVLREDQNHPQLSGNKWHKLQYHLHEALKKTSPTILSFGGAWSNHLHALSYAAKAQDIKLIAMIRGGPFVTPSFTLLDLAANGTEIHYLSYAEYKLRNTPDFLTGLQEQYGPFTLVPEGGGGVLGVRGCMDWAQSVVSRYGEFDTVVMASGTGTTLAGWCLGISAKTCVMGVPVLKGDLTPLKQEIAQLIHEYGGGPHASYTLLEDGHWGGYGKVPQTLKSWMLEIRANYQLELDGIYTAKALYALFNQMDKGLLKGQRVLFIHSGGLQGNRGIAGL